MYKHFLKFVKGSGIGERAVPTTNESLVNYTTQHFLGEKVPEARLVHSALIVPLVNIKQPNKTLRWLSRRHSDRVIAPINWFDTDPDSVRLADLGGRYSVSKRLNKDHVGVFCYIIKPQITNLLNETSFEENVYTRISFSCLTN